MAAFTDLFSGHAKLYAAARPTYPEVLIDELAALSLGREQAWDVGTGNGQLARALASRFDHVYASDASAEQIAAAEPCANVTFAVEPAEHTALPDASCDLVVAAQAMHWFDLDFFYAEAARVLRPGGLLAAVGYGWFYVDPEIDQIVGRTLLRPLQPEWAPGNWRLIDGYRNIPFPGEEVRIAPAAIHLAWTREQFEDYVLSWSAVQRLGAAMMADARRELATVWPDGQQRHVTMPITTRAARL